MLLRLGGVRCAGGVNGEVKTSIHEKLTLAFESLITEVYRAKRSDKTPRLCISNINYIIIYSMCTS